MAEDSAQFRQWLVEIVRAAAGGDASSYSEQEILTAIGAIWYSRRLIAKEPGEEEYTLPHLDVALEVLAAELEAREVLAENPLRDLGEQ